MSNCVPILNKPYSILTLYKCKYCKKEFEQLNYRQRYCQNDIDCRRLRRAEYRKNSHLKRSGISEDIQL